MDGVRVEQLANQPCDADRLARFGHHADDPFSDSGFRARTVLGCPAACDGDEHAVFMGRKQNHRVRKPEALFEPLENRVEQPFERVGALNPIGQILKRLHREDGIGR